MMQSRNARIVKAGLVVSLVVFALGGAHAAAAQGSGGPLTMEGLHQQENHSAAARAFGGVTIGRGGNVGSMFINPASMQGLDGIQLSLGGYRRYRDLNQVQQFAPVRYYPNLSLLLEGLTDSVPDPDPELVGFTPADSVQRPFDDIPPGWSRSNTTDSPLHALVAVPLTLGEVTLTAGVGAVQHANLDHYYQNNNVLDPEVLRQRPLPILRPTDNEPLTADWYQSIRSREGSIRGYGMALAAHVERYDLTVGLSGLLLNGETDDFEQRLERGTLTFLANEFRADSSVGRVTRTGTSEFSGSEFSLGSTLHGRYVSVGFVVKAPTKYTRSYNIAVEGDSAGASFTSTVNGEDEFQLPWRGSIGILLKPRENLNIGLEYEFRPYGSATYTTSAQEETSPWHSASLFRIGTEFEPTSWLTLRGGIRGEADVFIPDGSAIADDPVTYRVFSAGFGLNFSGIRWNLAYENSDMEYQDIWGSALSNNSNMQHAITTEISYTIPLRR